MSRITGTGLDPHPGSSLEPNPGSNKSTGLEPNPGSRLSNGRLMEAAESTREGISEFTDDWFDAKPRVSRLARLDAQRLVPLLVQQVLERLHVRDSQVWVTSDFNAGGAYAANAQRLLGLTASARFSDALQHQHDRVVRTASERRDAGAEIEVQADGLWASFGTVTEVWPVRFPRTTAYVEVAGGVVTAVGQALKHQFGCPRPAELSSRVQPVIPTPSHASLPSGHAAAAFTMQIVLQGLLGLADTDGKAVTLRRLARRAAQMRVVAGVHYPMDSCAGWLLAQTVGRFVDTCAAGGTVELGYGFDTTAFEKDHRLNLPLRTPKSWSVEEVPGCTPAPPAPPTFQVGPLPDLGGLRAMAVAELKAAGLRP